MQRLKMQLLEKKNTYRYINDTFYMARLVIKAWEGTEMDKGSTINKSPCIAILINKQIVRNIS